MKVYNKLVRDNIPKIIEDDGKTCKVSVLEYDDYIQEIRRKIVEEARELNEASTKVEMIEELADLYELLDYLLIEYKIDILKVKKRRIQKNMKNGGFDKRLFLHSVSE